MEHQHGDHVPADRMGIALSLVCMIHCFMTPFLMFFAPSLAVFFDSEWVHITLFTVIMPLALVAFWRSFRFHHNWRPVFFGVTGVVLLALEIIFHDLLENRSIHVLPIVMSISGGAMLAYGHYRNLRLCHRH